MNGPTPYSGSFLVRLFLSDPQPSSESELSDLQKFRDWREACEQILAKPFPPQSSDFPRETLERDSRLTFAKLSNWEIICQEILDTEYSHVYYQKCYAELRRRGKSDQEILEMRRCAWYTAGWFNFPMMLWDWVSLDEADMFRAIELLHAHQQISQTQRLELESFIRLHT